MSGLYVFGGAAMGAGVALAALVHPGFIVFAVAGFAPVCIAAFSGGRCG